MPQKLTEAEKETAIRLAKSLASALAPEHRSMASGIASGLVRLQLREDPLSASSVREVLKKYGAGDGTLKTLTQTGLLVRAGEGVYRLQAEASTGTGSATAPAGGNPGGNGAADTASDAAGAPKDAAASDIATRSARREAAPASGADGNSNTASPTSSAAGTSRRGSRRGERGNRPGTSLAKQGPRQLARIDTVRKQTPELNAIRRQIIDLDPRLWINGYLLSAPDAYLAYERELKALSDALDRRPTIGDGSLTMRELSYQIFGDEKFIAIESEGRKLLRLMGVGDLLRYRHAAKSEMLACVPKRRRHLKLVISENLDPFTNMRDAIFLSGQKRLLGERVHGVVFGDGHLVGDAQKLVDLVETLGAEDARVYYWGDLDRAGLELMAKLDLALRARAGRMAARAESVDETDADDGLGATPITLEPFAPAYRLMLKRAMRRFPDPLENRRTDQVNVPIMGFELLEPLLKKKEATYLRAVLDGARLIPQEIVTAADL